MISVDRRQFIKSGVVTAVAAGASVAQTGKKTGFHPASEAGRGIKVACSTNLWTKGANASFADALAGVSAAGYDWVEVDADDIWEFREQPDALRKMLDEHGLGLVTAALSGDFADREKRLKNISRAVLTARALQALGCGTLVLEGTGFGSIPRTPRNFHHHSTNLAELGALVYEETGLHCAYRFHEEEAADVRKIITTSDSRYTKFCFDTQSLAKLGITSAPMIKTYGVRVVHIQLREGDGGTVKETPNAVLAALVQADYNGWVVVKQDRVRNTPVKDAGEALRKLQPLVAQAKKAGEELQARTEAAPEPQAARRGMLRDLVTIGATLSSQPAAFLAPARFVSSDNSNPMEQHTHDMHGHMNRPVPPVPPLDPNFKPLFFSVEEYRDVSALADTIIPVTDTPGALAAQADEYADLMIWLDEEHHDDVHKSVAQFQSVCKARLGKPFAAATHAQQVEFLTALTGQSVPADIRPASSFFNRVRGLVVRGYYASPQGLLMDLGYKGNTYLAEFKGCTHPEHHNPPVVKKS